MLFEGKIGSNKKNTINESLKFSGSNKTIKSLNFDKKNKENNLQEWNWNSHVDRSIFLYMNEYIYIYIREIHTAICDM